MDDRPWLEHEDMTNRQHEAWRTMLNEQSKLGRTLTSIELGERLGISRDGAARVMRRLVETGYAMQVVESGRRGGRWSTRAVVGRIDRRDVAINFTRPKVTKARKHFSDSSERRSVQPLTDDERDVVDCNRGLAGWLVDKIRRPDEDRDELFQAAIFGLARAVQTCDAEKSSLQTHAIIWMRNTIQRHRLNNIGVVRVPIHQRNPVTARPEDAADVARADSVESLSYPSDEGGFAVAADPNYVDPFDAMSHEETIDALRTVLRVALPDRQASVMESRMQGASLAAAGRKIGVSGEMARLLERQAIATISGYMAKYAS